MKSVWTTEIVVFIVRKFSSSPQILDLSNSCLVHNLPLSERRMSKNDCDTLLGMLARPWALHSSAKSEYQSRDDLDILYAGRPCLTYSLRRHRRSMVRPERCSSPPLQQYRLVLRDK